MIKASKSLFAGVGGEEFTSVFADHFVSGDLIAGAVQSQLLLAPESGFATGVADGEPESSLAMDAVPLVSTAATTTTTAAPAPAPAPATFSFGPAAPSASTQLPLFASSGSSSHITSMSGLSPSAGSIGGLGGLALDGITQSIQPIGGFVTANWSKLKLGLGDVFTAATELAATNALSGEGDSALDGFETSSPMDSIVDGYIAIDAVATNGNTAALLERLEALGLQNGAAFGSIVSGYIPLDRIDDMSMLAELRFARPSYVDFHTGSVLSQDDHAMATDTVRTGNGLTGAGVTIGIISDSFDTRVSALSHYAQDIASGDLPAGVFILQDAANRTDEGRAMAQQIYDVAPGASLAFATALGGEANFANNILLLRSIAGADIIVDDVRYLFEPYFQDGIIAQAVDSVVANGAIYFSSAGNYGDKSYESDFRNSGMTITGVPAGAPVGTAPITYILHDFDPGVGVDVTQQWREIGAEAFLMQWDEAFASLGGAGSRMDLAFILTDSSGTFIIDFDDSVGGDPIEAFVNNYSTAFITTFQLSIGVRQAANPLDTILPGHIKIVPITQGGDAVMDEYNTRSGTSWGHSNAEGAMAVGAADWFQTPGFGQNPPLAESFTSKGGVPIYFDKDGNRLATPEMRDKVEFTAPDGGNTTFFSSDVARDADTSPNFYGTSSAAPNAAAMAALLLGAFPDATKAMMETALKQSAIDIVNISGNVNNHSVAVAPVPGVGYDLYTGAGLIQGPQALAALTAIMSTVSLYDGSNVLVGTFTTIQAAVNAASDGYRIVAGARTYAENVTVNKDVTIEGPNAGINGNAARGDEAIVNGLVSIVADGVTLDGLTITGAPLYGQDITAIFVNNDNATLTNLILDGPDDGYGIQSAYGATGLILSNSLVTEWGSGTYFNPGAGFTATGNSFTGNGNDIAGDGWDASSFIDNNSFHDSAGSHIGYGTYLSVEDMRNFVGTGNTFTGTGRPVGIFAYGDGTPGGQDITGTEYADGFFGSEFVAGSGNDSSFHGLGGNDYFHGAAGNDAIDGGSGIDTAAYDGIATIAENISGWTVDDGSGTDTLENVEIVDDSAPGKILLVQNGGYATIQEAIDAAANGDTILVAAGTYVENLNVNKDVTILGANHGVAGTAARGAESIVDGQIVVNAAGASIDGFKLVGAAPGSLGDTAVEVKADNFALSNSILDGSGFTAIVTSSVGTVDIGHNLIEGYSIGVYVGGGNTAGSIHDNRFQGDGGPISGLGNGVNSESSHLAIANNTFDGIYAGSLNIFPFGPDTVDLQTYITGNTITNSGVARPVQIQPTALTHNILGTNFNEAFIGDNGVAGPLSFDGRGGNDKAWGSEQDDSLAGGTGDDELYGNSGNDTLRGDEGADLLDGGSGLDTAVYSGPATILENAGAWIVTDAAGTDTLTSVEFVDDNAAGKTLLVGFGGYATIQEALDAAAAGDTIRVASGTWNETLDINKDVTIQGANYGTSGVVPRGPETVINGQLTITAAGATIDGVKLIGGATGSLGTTSVEVKANDFALLNSVLDGGNALDTAIITGSAITGLDIGRNLILGYGVGIYVAGGTTSGSIHNNRFQGDGGPATGLGNGVNSESSHVTINNNVFDGLYSGSLTLFPFGPDTVDLTSYVFGNAIINTPVARPVQIYPTDLTHNILGTNFNEAFIGDYGITGPLSFDGRGGDDRAWGSEQGDSLSGGTGNDQLFGNGGDDTLSGGDNDDIVQGGAGNDTADGGNGNDIVSGEAGNDILAGGAGVDTLNGGDDDDNLEGGSGNDTLNGENGNDTMRGGAGNDSLNGGAGTDTAVYDGHRGDYSIGMITGAGGRIVGFSSVSDNEPSNGNEGADALTSVERVQFTNRTLDATLPVQLFDQTNQLVGTFSTIQAAIDGAQDNYTIRLAAGDYHENLVIPVGVTIRGAKTTPVTDINRGVATGVGESNIIGHAKVTAEDNVTFIGLRFVNDATTTGGGAANPTLQFLTAAAGPTGHKVEDSIFWSTVAGGADGVGDRAISAAPFATGNITLEDNLISGASQGLVETASWGRGISFDGGGADLTATGNIVEWTRYGMALDGAGGSIAIVSNNILRNLGTAFSITTNEDVLAASGNDFQNVADEFSFATMTEDVVFAAFSAFDTLVPVGNSNDLIVIRGGTGNDVLTGSALDDLIDGNGSTTNPTAADNDTLNGGLGNDLLFGRYGDDSLRGGSGDDTMDGGDGIDTAFVGPGATLVANGSTWTVTSTQGVDTLINVERVDSSSGLGSDILLVGSGGFATIQAAVNAANDGDVILVAAGTYIEQVVVNDRDNLTIRAADGAQVTIQAPADLVETARSSSDREIHAVFTVINSQNVVLENIDVDGNGAGNTVDEGGGAGQANFYGTFYRNSSGGLLGVDVTGVRDPILSGAQRGVGVVVDNAIPQLFTMTGGSITDFQKNATVFNGAILSITGVTITGAGATGVIAQNGIQVTNSTGTISDNIISDLGYTGAGTFSVGVLAFNNTDLNVTDNTITGANDDTLAAKVVGIYVYQTNSGGSISGNTISYVDTGIGVYGDVTPNPIIVEDNTITNVDTTGSSPAGVDFEPNPALTTPHDVDGSAADDILSGGAGNDSLSGLGGNDLLRGNGGDDTLAGDGGTDTAVYAGPRSGYTIVTVTDGSGHVIGYSSVTDADTGNGDEGADTLTSVEKLSFGDGILDLTQPVQLFDDNGILVGTFGTIQAAINAASNGYSISAAAGTYNEVINVNKDVTITGPNVGKTGTDVTRGAEAVIKGAYMSADGATLDGLKVAYDGTLVAGNPTGILVDHDNITLTNLVIDGIDQSASSGIVTTYNGGVTGLAISRNLITDFFWGAYLNPTTGFTATANTFTSNTAVDIAGDDWAAGTQIGGNDFPDAITHIGYSTNQTDFDFDVFLGAPNTFGGTGRVISVTGRGDGDAGGQTLHGTAYNDSLTDSSAAPSGIDGALYGEGGDDRLSGGTGDDLLIGGAGSDILRGGTGVDTATYADPITLANLAPVADGDPSSAGNQPGWTVTTATEGTDSLTGVEIIDGAGSGQFLLVGSGGFTTIQAAVDAANDGDTILVAAGTYIEQVVVDGFDDLTIMAVPGAQVTIQAPADLHETARSSSDREIHAVFTVTNSTSVELTDIDIDGHGAGNTVDEGGGAGIANFYGVYYRNSSGTLSDVDITGVRDPYPGGNTPGGQPNVDGVQRGVALVVDNDVLMAFAMHGGTISDFQKQAGTFVRANLDISGVTVIGGGAQPVIAQNGFSINRSTGTVTGNTLTGIGYAGPDANTYSGVILASSNTDLVITDNIIGGSNGDSSVAKVVGIWIYQNGPVNSGGEISGNTISYTDVGIAVDNSITPNPLLIEDNSVTNADLTDPFSAGVRFEPMPISVTTAFDIDGTQMHDKLSGNAGNDILSALGGNDELRGNGGNDQLDGGSGIDTATYAGPAAIVQNGAAWTVTDAGGVDSLVNIEIVDDSAPGVTRLVGNGGYATIQAAIDASSNGDIIIVASGTYVENLNVNKDVTILGANHGTAGTGARGSESVIDGQIVINADGVSIDGFKLVGAAPGSLNDTAVEVMADNFSLSNSVLDGNGYVAIITGSVTGLDVHHNLIEGYSIGVYVSGGGTTGSIHDNRFQGDGGPITGLGNGVNSESSHVAISQNVFDGIYAGSLNIFPFGPDTVDLQTYITGNTITDSGVARPVQILPTNSTHNILGTDFNEAFDGETAAASYGVTGAFSFDGRGGDDKAWGGEQGDSLTGGSGDDELNGNGGDDVLTGGGDDDSLNGGSGYDTATYAGPISDYTVTYTTDGNGQVTGISSVVDNVPAGGDEGSDTLTSIEAVSFGGNTIDFADSVQLFDEDDNLVATFGTIQAAIDAASDDYTIRLAAGTYVENIDVDKDVTILGPNHGIDGSGARGAEAIIDGQVTISAAGVTIDGVKIVGDALGSLGNTAVEVLANNFTLTNSVLNGAGDTAIITGTVTGLDISNNLIQGYSIGVYVSGATTSGSIHDNVFQGDGGPSTGLGNGVNSETSHVTIADNVFDGIYAGSLNLFPFGPDTVDLTSYVNGNTITNSGAARPVQILPTNATHNILGTDFNEAFDGETAAGTYGVTGAFSFDGRGGDDRAWGAGGADSLSGGSGDDQLFGNGGNDLLDGGTGNDLMVGGSGDDAYVVDSASDVVTEASGEGTDEIRTALATYTLAALPYVENLTGLGTVDQVLTGNDANNVIDGGLGADAMTGGLGNDTYVVDDAGDTVTENAGEGTDEIRTSLAFFSLATLPNVENLTGTSANPQFLVGNGSANVIRGGVSHDMIDGGLGADTMIGGDGSDYYWVDNAGDIVIENAGEGAIDLINTTLATYSLFGTEVEWLLAGSNINHDFRGSTANNYIAGANGNDFIRLQDGGNDRAYGGEGNDVFLFGSTMTTADEVDGQGGSDQIAIQGDYSGVNALTLGTGVLGFESFAILPGNDIRFGDPGTNFYDYDITTQDVNVAAGVRVIVDANRLRPGEDFTFNGSAETDGGFFIWGGGGVDTLTGGSMTDIFYFGENLQFGASDTVNGGAGIDQLGLRGNYTIVFGAGQIAGIENIGLVSAQDTRFGALGSTFNYNLTMNDANLASGVLMTVDGAALRNGETLTFNGLAETDGLFRIFGGQGNDTIKTGAGNDIIRGGGGADELIGYLGADTFRYDSVTDSMAGAYDLIGDFVSMSDKFDLSRIDANSNVAGDQAFTWIGGNTFNGVAGELRTYAADGLRWIAGDTDGDGDGDLLIAIQPGGPIPVQSDFLL